MGRGRGKGAKPKAQPKGSADREIYRQLHSKLSYLKKKGGKEAADAEKALACLNSTAEAREEILEKFASDHKCTWLSSTLCELGVFFKFSISIYIKIRYSKNQQSIFNPLQVSPVWKYLQPAAETQRLISG